MLGRDKVYVVMMACDIDTHVTLFRANLSLFTFVPRL
jgi:hypothetical protein